MTHDFEFPPGGTVFDVRCSCGWVPKLPEFRLRKRAARLALTASLGGATLAQLRHHVRFMALLEVREAARARADAAALVLAESVKEHEEWRRKRLEILPQRYAAACGREWGIGESAARRFLARWAAWDAESVEWRTAGCAR